MRRIILLFAFIATIFTIEAEAPKGYYAGITGLKDSALKNKLYEIISDHSANDYNGLFRLSFCYTDVRSDGTWWDMYSNIARNVKNGWSGMNREHSFPKSWWGGSQDVLAYTDLNHLYPSDATANGAKNYYPLGEVSSTGITFDNGLVLVGNPVEGQGGGSRYVFEPADEYKGDFARTYFYMVTCYQNLTWKYTYMAKNGSYPTLQGWAIDLLLKWHRADPVSPKETARNDEVYKLQYNRNPFIDYPNLVEYIWGSKKGEPFEDSELPPIGDGTLISPENNSTIQFGDVVYGDGRTMIIPIRGQLSANLSLKIYGDNASDFTIPTTTIPWTDVNTGGYDLVINFTPTDLGERNAKLLLYDGGLKDVTSYVVNLTGMAHELPTFDNITALAATDVTSNSFRANWNAPANPSVIDYYVVNLSEYEGGNMTTRTITTDGDDTFLDIDDLNTAASYSYTVQSSRFGRLSDESNIIFVNLSGISTIDSVCPMVVLPIGRGVCIRCSDTHTNVRIIDITGRIVKRIAELRGESYELLPYGAYLVVSDQSRCPVKVLVRE